MVHASREFQIFAKPIGAICNLDCQYCYYLKKEHLYPKAESFRMPNELLEEYIVQHIDASTEGEIRFSWHGGEPTLLGLEFFQKIVEIQRTHCPENRAIVNGIQTNGTLLDDNWCRFLATEHFVVGLSLDGPKELHDKYRVTKNQRPTHDEAMRGYRLLQKHKIYADILCVVNSHNVRFPLEVYRYFKQIDAQYINFLPLVEPLVKPIVSPATVPSEAWGEFLCTIFDEWRDQDIGRVKVQMFEEATRVAFNQEHSLCIFRPTCGDVPVIEHNGDFYACDHFVDPEYRLGNIRETPLVELLDSPPQREFGLAKLTTLPRYCRECEVRPMCNGECPKNRFITTPDGEPGLNYLCAGYKRFFTHCQPFVSQVASQWKLQNIDRTFRDTPIMAGQKPGRNELCPCGSGLKYKKCCLGKLAS